MNVIERIQIMQKQRLEILNRIQRLESTIEAAGIKNDKLRIKASAFNAFEERMAMLIDLKDELMERDIAIQKEIDRIMGFCREHLTPIQYEIVFRRIYGETFAQIGDALHYSDTNIHYHFKKAIKTLNAFE